MIRITKTSVGLRGREINLACDDDVLALDALVNKGTPVTLVKNIQDLDKLRDINSMDVVMP